MKRIEIVAGLSILMLGISTYYKLPLFYPSIVLYLLCIYCDYACTMKLPFCTPIRKFLFRFDYKHFIIKRATRVLPPLLGYPFLVSISFDNTTFIELGFDKGMKKVLRECVDRLEKTSNELVRISKMINNLDQTEYIEYLKEQAEEQEREENEDELDMLVPDWKSKLHQN